MFISSFVGQVHKKLSPYMCDMCHETFKRKKLLLEHIGKIHVAHGEAAKAMQAYIRKIEETGDDDEDEMGQHTITIAPAGSSHHDSDETTTVYAQVCALSSNFYDLIDTSTPQACWVNSVNNNNMDGLNVKKEGISQK